MKLFQWLLAFALCFMLFNDKDDSAQNFFPTAKVQHSFFKKPAEKSKEIHNTKQAKQTIAAKINGLDPIIPYFGSTSYFRRALRSFALSQCPLSVCVLKLDILSAKHHPPTI